MTPMVISLAESALGDLKKLQALCPGRGVAGAGARFVAEVLERVQTLAEPSETDRVVPEFDQPFLRELIHPPFRILYRRDPHRLRVVRVWRSDPLLSPPAGSEDSV